MLDLIAPRHAHLSTTTQASFDKTSFILSSPCQGLNDRESRVHCFLFTRASSSNRTSLHWPHPLCLTTSSLSRSSLLSIFQYGGYVLFSLSPSLSPHCVCVCVCVCGCLTDSHLCAPTLSPSRSLSLSPSVVFSLKLTHTLYRSISYCLSLAHAHSLSLSLPLALSLSLSVRVSLFPSTERTGKGVRERDREIDRVREREREGESECACERERQYEIER